MQKENINIIIMKKLLLIVVIVISSLSSSAQREVTKFLGIPVDGTKATMIQKLKEKGFVYNPKDDFLTGDFNGHKVNVGIITYKNKVWRIMVIDHEKSTESEIKIKFNNLLHQFSRNKKYRPFSNDNYIIPEDEDISFNMSMYSKGYSASYCQIPEDTVKLNKIMHDSLVKKYGEDYLADTTKAIRDAIKQDKSEFICNILNNRKVWFMINKFNTDFDYDYVIFMYYDNGWNNNTEDDL